MPIDILKAPKAIQFKCESNGQLIVVQVDLFGATLTKWQINNKNLIFVSSKAIRDGSKAIRGGIPLVFPQFGKVEPPNPASELPQHGFARVCEWSYEAKLFKENSSGGTLVFSLDNEMVKEQKPELYKLWPFKFELKYIVTIEGQELTTSLEVHNLDSKDILVSPLLHTYFTVKNIESAKVSGLSGSNYIDKVNISENTKVEENDLISISNETDRIYIGGNPKNKVALLTDGPSSDKIEIDRINMPDTVVWNPWVEKSTSMADLGDEDFKQFICVEVGHVYNPKSLPPNQPFSFGQTLKYHMKSSSNL